MMNEEYIDEHFRLHKVKDRRWRFEPVLRHGSSATPPYRYFLTFFTTERRFILSRQKVAPIETISDEEQLSIRASPMRWSTSTALAPSD